MKKNQPIINEAFLVLYHSSVLCMYFSGVDYIEFCISSFFIPLYCYYYCCYFSPALNITFEFNANAFFGSVIPIWTHSIKRIIINLYYARFFLHSIPEKKDFFNEKNMEIFISIRKLYSFIVFVSVVG